MKKLLFTLYSVIMMLLLAFSGCEKTPDSVTPGKIISPDKNNLNSSDSINSDTLNKKPKLKVTSQNTTDLLNYMNSSPDSLRYEEGILKRMAEDSPEYTYKLINSEFSHFIIVDKQVMELALFDQYGREELRYGIACGKNYGTKVKKGDSRTSEGFFSAEGIYDSTDWLFTDDNGYTSPKKGQFGPRFIRLEIPNTRAIGIHGTVAPWSIGHRCSHGCIRVKNENILELVNHVTVGMPIIVSPSDRDASVNSSEGRYIPQVTINPNSKRKPQPEIKNIEPSKNEQNQEEENIVLTTPEEEKVSTEAEEIQVPSTQPVEIPETIDPS